MTGDAVEQTITAETITELRTLLANATEQPWEAWSGRSAGGGEYITGRGGYTFGISPGYSDREGFDIAQRDAALIVAAVNALPALLDELDRLRAEGGTGRDAACTCEPQVSHTIGCPVVTGPNDCPSCGVELDPQGFCGWCDNGPGPAMDGSDE